MSTVNTHDTDAVRTLARRFTDEVLNGHDLDDALTELVAIDFVEQNPLPGQGPAARACATCSPE